MDGIINFLKPTGMTSSDAVMKVRGALKTKKVGHLGTLDPLACGVLPIAVGRCTRLFDLFLKKEKVYRAFFDFNKTTDTLDSDGVVTNYSEKDVTENCLKMVIEKNLGEINQAPPIFSAKRVDGKRAYDLARSGAKFELKPSLVNIKEMKIVREYAKNCFVVDVNCSAGTYIRSIARDLASEMGVFGYMSALIRLSSGNFFIENAVLPSELNECPTLNLVSPEKSIEFLPRLDLMDEKTFFYLKNGVKQSLQCADGYYRLYFQNGFVGLARSENTLLHLELNFGEL